MASAKLANSTVNHSHTTIWNSNSRLWVPVTRSRNRMTVVSAVTTSSTNITGFVIRVRGLSLTKAEPIAGTTILGSSRAETGIRLRNVVVVSIEVSPSEAGQNSVLLAIARCSTMGPSASAGKNVSPPTITTTPTTRPTNRPPVVGKVPADGGTDFLAASEPAIAMAGMIIQNRPTNIATAPARL